MMSMNEIINVDVSNNSRKDIFKKMSSNNIKVLVVEDDNQNRHVYELFTKMAGYNPITATGYTDGLEKYLLESPDIIVTDINFSNSSGFQKNDLKTGIDLIGKIRELELQSDYKIPIIACTAYGIANDFESFLKSGATAFFIKPFMYKDYTAIIDKYAKETQQRRMGISNLEN